MGLMEDIAMVVGVIALLAMAILTVDAFVMVRKLKRENEWLLVCIRQARRDAEIVGNALKMEIRENLEEEREHL